MQVLTKERIESLLSESPDDILRFVHSLVKSGEPEQRKMAAELSQALRRAGRCDEAARAANELFVANPSADNLNLWFVAVVDEGDVAKIRAMSERVRDFLERRDEHFNLHLFSTWLKAANRIDDDKMFLEVLARIPNDELRRNSYLAFQYLIFLSRKERYEEMVAWCESLPEMTRTSQHVRRLYDSACAKLGWVAGSKGLEGESGRSARPLCLPDFGVLEDARIREATGVFVLYSGKSSAIPALELMGRCGLGIEMVCCDEVECGVLIEKVFAQKKVPSVFVLVEGKGECDDTCGRDWLLVCLGYLATTRRRVYVIEDEELPTGAFRCEWGAFKRIDASDPRWAVELYDALAKGLPGADGVSEER